jgi:hypothetical protein
MAEDLIDRKTAQLTAQSIELRLMFLEGDELCGTYRCKIRRMGKEYRPFSFQIIWERPRAVCGWYFQFWEGFS